jgi:hypothetical protein
MNKLVKRILGTVLTEHRLAGDNPNWTEVLVMVAAPINSQHNRGKDDVSLFEAVYGQVLNHDMTCSKAEARQCWTLPQLLKVTNDAEFAEYAANNYNLDEDSPDAAEQDDTSGYFSDEELQDDEKEEVTDDDFFNLLNQNVLENDTTRKRPPEEEHLNLEEINDFTDMVGLVNDATMFDAEVTYHMDELQRRTANPLPYAGGHWQGNAALGSDANYEDYNQTFKVDEQHNISTTPEKKHFKSDEVDSPEVTRLTEFLTTVLKVEIHTNKFLHGKQPQSGEDHIEARTVNAHEAAMLVVPSPTARVQLLGQLHCDWVTQCCVRKEETPDHCTFGLDSSSRQCTRPVHFECQLAWETYAKLSHKKNCSSKVCREQFQWRGQGRPQCE